MPRDGHVRCGGRLRETGQGKPRNRARSRSNRDPVCSHPLLTGFGAGYLCPVPYLALAKATPWGVYFTGLSRHGEGFTRDLGHLFEQYIGRQLRLLPGAQVLGEVTYGRKNSRKTVGWIVILPEVVLLIEVKSAIPTEPVRLGTPEAAGAVLVKLGKAFKQIDVTAQLIADNAPVLAAVPTGRPVLGLAVTLEPFHIANVGFDLFPVTRTPVTVADVTEIENLATITGISPGRLLLDRAADDVRSTWSLDTAFEGRTRGRNPVLDEAWDSYQLGTGRPRLPQTVPLSPADPGGDRAAQPSDVCGRPVLTQLQPIRGIRSQLASAA